MLIGDTIKSNKRKHVIVYMADYMFGRFCPSKNEKTNRKTQKTLDGLKYKQRTLAKLVIEMSQS